MSKHKWKSKSLTERVKHVIDHLVKNDAIDSDSEFYARLGIDSSTASLIRSEKREFPKTKTVYIVNEFDINPDFLLKGFYPISLKRAIEENEKSLQKQTTKDPKSLPYYNVEVMASPIEVINDQTTAPEYHLTVPGFEDCDFVCAVYGDSMYPTIKNGTRIICKKVDTDIIDYGEIYFLVTKDYRMVKRLRKGSDPDHVKLRSDNYQKKDEDGERIYEDFEIHKKEILSLYVVKGWLNQNRV